MKNKKVVLSFSGGADCTTVLAHMLDEGREVLPVFFYYGSKHNKLEAESAWHICKYYDVPLHQIGLKDVFGDRSSSIMMFGGIVPEGHHEDPKMETTIVPARNLVFLSVLTSYALQKEAPLIAIGAHKGDAKVYPDCRPAFLQSFTNTIGLIANNEVSVLAPFINMSKVQIIERGIDLGVPYDLTRTCYTSSPQPCGKCPACTERNDAFELLGLN